MMGGGGGTTGLSLTTAGGQTCVTKCTRIREHCVPSSLFRSANLAFLFFRVPRSCIKFAFPRARVPKMPGTQERKNRNVRPSLFVALSFAKRGKCPVLFLMDRIKCSIAQQRIREKMYLERNTHFLCWSYSSLQSLVLKAAIKHCVQ